MVVKRMWRVLFAVAFLFATQVALVHPFAHFEDVAHAADAGSASADTQHPFELSHAQQCDVCTAAIGFSAVASSSVLVPLADDNAQRGASGDAHPFVAVFTPLF